MVATARSAAPAISRLPAQVAATPPNPRPKMSTRKRRIERSRPASEVQV
jgi:hypothetical protein